MFQYGNTGLNFIAIPRLTYYMGSEGLLWLRLYMIYLYLLSIDTTYGFVEGLVCNIVEASGLPRLEISFFICSVGAGITILFCSNVGWILVDATEHFLYSIMIPCIGLLECIIIGWNMGPPTPAKRAVRVLGILYWVPLIIIALIFAFAFEEYRFWAPVPIIFFTVIGMFLSKCCGRMPLKLWYE
jgi:SNF family Na+-dependent transporter